ncbi:MAG: Mobile element protein [Nitrospira sp.]|nr:MAG: Mobile element protein [Nitrospira sp.]
MNPHLRGGSGNSDSVRSGSLASPKPPSGGVQKEQGDEENTTESRSDKAQVALAAVKGDKTLAELTEQFSIHPTQVTDWKQQRLARAADVFGGDTTIIEHPGSEDVPCEDQVTDPGPRTTNRVRYGAGAHAPDWELQSPCAGARMLCDALRREGYRVGRRRWPINKLWGWL